MPQPVRISVILLLLAGYLSGPLNAQRNYADHSVLASGNWYKIAVNSSGIYRLDLPFLQLLGINTSSLASSDIRVYGNGGSMLPENPEIQIADDLKELAISIEDGGDGIINGSDRILFYAQGPSRWFYDSTGNFFRHEQHLYSRQTYYYLNISPGGKRIQTTIQPIGAATTISEYDDLQYRELDSFNLLSSGKTWLGEEFSDAPGKFLSRNFQIPNRPSPVAGASQIRARLAARAFGNQSSFLLSYGNSGVNIEIPAVAAGPYDQFARSADGFLTFSAEPGIGELSLRFQPGSANSQGWLDWLELRIRRRLEMTDSALFFRDAQNAAPGRILKYEIQNASAGVQVWDLTEWQQPFKIDPVLTGPTASFNIDASRLREFVAFAPSQELRPTPLGRVTNQDLHAIELNDYLIISHESLLEQANRLAAFHTQRSGLRVKVVTAAQVFNEFSSGIPDPVAIRDFVKMQYDRSGGDSTKRAKYLLLFGKGSFDYKDRITGNTNLVPVYETDNSFDPLSTYTSDDFFGFLDDGDNFNGSGIYLLDIGIGRIPAASLQEAKSIVDKIIGYHDPAALGPWRNEFTMVADDED
ncbi:MAG: type IX secretion system sortase PorU, partial [Flavitalea sp.]